jgi:hypothetical protein
MSQQTCKWVSLTIADSIGYLQLSQVYSTYDTSPSNPRAEGLGLGGASFLRFGNGSMCEERLECRGVLIDPKKKRCAVAGHNLTISARSLHRANTLLFSRLSRVQGCQSNEGEFKRLNRLTRALVAGFSPGGRITFQYRPIDSVAHFAESHTAITLQSCPEELQERR